MGYYSDFELTIYDAHMLTQYYNVWEILESYEGREDTPGIGYLIKTETGGPGESGKGYYFFDEVDIISKENPEYVFVVTRWGESNDDIEQYFTFRGNGYRVKIEPKYEEPDFVRLGVIVRKNGEWINVLENN